MVDSETTVRVERRGRVGRLLLNRPKALNALDYGMICAIRDALDAWRDDPQVHAVVIEGKGGRAFCAGGDIREGRRMALAGDRDAIETYFRDEYGLNAAIAAYPKPYISLIDGICMGGGLGISVHGAYRVATEHALCAMPETAIGLFPDVGATFFLPRLPGALGMWMGLTGARLLGADAVHAGIATHYVPRASLPRLVEALVEDGPGVLAAFVEPLPPAGYASQRATIDRCFGQDSLDAVRAALSAEGGDWAAAQLATLEAMSPSSLLWTFQILRAGRQKTLAQALEAELALTRSVMFHPDFAEGVRAMVVDKDRTPRWISADDQATRAILAGLNVSAT